MGEQAPTLAIQVIPPPRARRDLPALEGAFQAFALGRRQPIALEIAREAGASKFLLRARNGGARAHLKGQVQARYSQAQLRDLSPEEDPLVLRPHEAITVVELRPMTEHYLPVRVLERRDSLQEGADPVLGILAALDKVPEGTRAIAQLALLPASPRWSQAVRRKAVEHPLDPERARLRSQGVGGGSGAAPALGMLLLAALLFVALRVLPWLHTHLPAWEWQAGSDLLSGQAPHLSAAQSVLLAEGLALVLIPLLALAVAFTRLRARLRQAHIYDMRLVQQKTGSTAYRARLRLYVIAPGERARLWQLWLRFRDRPFSEARKKVREIRRQQRQQARERRDIAASGAAAYRQFEQSAGTYFRPVYLPLLRAECLLAGPRSRWEWWAGWFRGIAGSPLFLTGEEGLGMWHPPQGVDLYEAAGVERTQARTFLAPLEVTRGGEQWQCLGTSQHAGHELPVYLPLSLLRGNSFIVASTGAGKSTLQQYLGVAALYAGIQTGDRVFFLDPHNGSVPAMLEHVPSALRDGVIVIDLADQDFPCALNLLDATRGNRHKVVPNLLAICAYQWRNAWGPRTELVLEMCLRTLFAYNCSMIDTQGQAGPDMQRTILDIIPLLRNYSFRHKIMERVSDPAIKSWWQLFFEPMDMRYQTEMISSVVNKMAKYMSSHIARNLLGQPRSKIDMAEIVRQGKHLFVNAPSGIVGEDVASLIGTALLGLFMAAVEEQVQLPIEERRHYQILVDEFQFFGGANYQGGLSGLRKMGGHFSLATQSLDYLNKLDRLLLPTVLANISHLFIFTTSGADARMLEQEVDRVVEVGDMTTLSDHECYARLSFEGRRLPLFSFRLARPQPGDPSASEHIRRNSRELYANPLADVEPLITARFEELLLRESVQDKASRQGDGNTWPGSPGPGAENQRRRHPPRKPESADQAGRVGPEPGGTAPADSMHYTYSEESTREERGESSHDDT